MRQTNFAGTVLTFAVLVALAACGSRPQPAPAPDPASPAGARTPPGAVIRQDAQPQACTREGEACKAAGAVCCSGLICTGSASGICISRH